MKTAIIVCGQPRFVNECFPFIEKNIIAPNDADVFAHLWFGEQITENPYKHGGAGEWEKQRIEKKSIDDFVKLYSPIELEVEAPKEFKNSSIQFNESLKRYFWGAINNPKEPDFKFRTIRDNYSAKYSLLQSNLLKKVYELENNFKYDCVIKIRTDLVCHSQINVQDYDTGFVHYKEMGQKDGMISDWMNLSSSRNMDIYSSVFNLFEVALEECLSDTGAYCNEMLIKKTLDFFGVKTMGNNWALDLPRF